MNLAQELKSRQPLVQPSPVPDTEYVNGYGIFSNPFNSGHVLALRVFPENDFGAYVTVWHRTPEGSWSIYVDGTDQKYACPRYYGQAADYVKEANITLTWTGPKTLRVEVDDPQLEWAVTMTSTPVLSAMNRISTMIPESLWRKSAMLRTFEKVGNFLFNLGSITLSGILPNGQFGILMPQRMYFIEKGQAILEGENLGRPSRSKNPVTIGDLRLPQKPVFAIGRGYFFLEEERRETAVLKTSITSVR